MLEIAFWALVGPAALAALLSVKTGRNFLEHVEGEIKGEPDPDERPYQPPATLILPVKGVDHDLAANLRSLASQDYPDYEFIVAARSEDDPAVGVVRMTLAERARLVFAGAPPAGTGEKVHNLLAAVAAARTESEVLAFADSDGQVASGWLTELVQPLGDEGADATTGFRWYFPEEGGFWPLLRSAWDATIVSRLGENERRNFAWGGAMALRRETFEATRVAAYWSGSVSDDYRLAQALNDAGRGIRFAPAAMVATTGGCSRDQFLAWATRQMVITKVYRKGLWVAGLIAHVVYCGAMVVSLAMALSGNLLGAAGFVVTLVPGMAQGAARGYAGSLMFPEREDWFERFGWIYFWLTPLATWVWLYAFLASALTRRIRWRGNEYELLSASETRLLGSADSAEID